MASARRSAEAQATDGTVAGCPVGVVTAEDSHLTWCQATRHTFASHYMMAGDDLAQDQGQIGPRGSPDDATYSPM